MTQARVWIIMARGDGPSIAWRARGGRGERGTGSVTRSRDPTQEQHAGVSGIAHVLQTHGVEAHVQSAHHALQPRCRGFQVLQGTPWEDKAGVPRQRNAPVVMRGESLKSGAGRWMKGYTVVKVHSRRDGTMDSRVDKTREKGVQLVHAPSSFPLPRIENHPQADKQRARSVFLTKKRRHSFTARGEGQ